MLSKENEYKSAVVTVYTIVHTAADADHGEFPDPVHYGSFLFRAEAKDFMASLIKEEKERLSPRYDTVNEDGDVWEAYEDGYAAARFSRFEIFSSELHMDDSNMVTERCPHCEAEITLQWSVEEYGYRAFCPVCGEALMLCDECRHAGDKGCDYDAGAKSCMLGSASRYPELSAYRDHHLYLPIDGGKDWLECYEIIFEADDERFYCFVDAEDMEKALGRFFMAHPHITYNMVTDHVEAGISGRLTAAAATVKD